MIRFRFDGDTVEFSARERGEDWNGFLQPVVDRPTFEAVIARLNERDDERTFETIFQSWGVQVFEYEWDDDGRKIVGEHELYRDSDGGYPVSLGLTLIEVD